MPKKKWYAQHNYTDGFRNYFINCIVGTRITFTVEGERKTVSDSVFSRMKLKPVDKLPTSGNYKAKPVITIEQYKKQAARFYKPKDAKKN